MSKDLLDAADLVRARAKERLQETSLVTQVVNANKSQDFGINTILTKPTTNKTRVTFLLADETLEALRLLEIEAKKVAKAMGRQPGRASRSWITEAAVLMVRQDFLALGDKSDLAKLMKLLPPTGQERS